MFGRYTTGPVLFGKRAVVYHAHYCMSISICPIVIKCRICRCQTAWIMDIHKVAFMRPVEKPVRVTHGEIYTSVRLRIAKTCSPVSAMQSACLIEINRPRNVIQIVVIRWIVIAHRFGLFFLIDLEESWFCPERLQPAGDDR